MQRTLHALSLDAVGGVERLFASFVSHQTVRERMENHVLVTGRPVHRFFRDTIESSVRSIAQVRSIGPLTIPRHPQMLRRRHIRRFLDRLRPDRIILWNHFGDVRLAEEAKRIDATVIYYDHGGAWWGQRGGASERRFLSMISGVICCAAAGGRVLNKRMHWQGPTRVCLNPLRPELKPSSTQQKEAPIDRPLRLGVAGRLIPVKGQVLAVHALARLRELGRDAQLHLAGVGQDEVRLKEVARRLGVMDSLIMHGMVRDMTGFYSMIDIFLCPSLREPCCLVNIEAQAWGCPVVSADIDGLREAIISGYTGVLLQPTLARERYIEFGGNVENLPELVYDPSRDEMSPPRLVDPRAIADEVARLADSPQRFAAMSRAAHDHACTTLDHDRHVNELMDAIDALAGAPAAVAG